MQDNRVYVGNNTGAFIKQSPGLDGISLYDQTPTEQLRIDPTAITAFEPINMSGFQINSLANPTLDQDAATKIWTLAQIPLPEDKTEIISTDNFSRLKCQDIGFISKRLAGIELEDEKLINGV